MGKYSIEYKGRVLDYRFKKQRKHVWVFYIGNYLVGHVFNQGRTWAGVAINPYEMNGLAGFKTRIDACDYLLRLSGYVPKDGHND